MTTPATAPPSEAWTPIQAEEAIRVTTRQVHAATVAYRDSGIALIEAKRAHMMARTKAAFDPRCPRVVRGEVTVGDRESWITRQIGDEAMALFAAEVMRENAIEMLRSSRVEHSGAMSLNASAREAYRMFTGVE